MLLTLNLLSQLITATNESDYRLGATTPSPLLELKTESSTPRSRPGLASPPSYLRNLPELYVAIGMGPNDSVPRSLPSLPTPEKNTWQGTASRDRILPKVGRPVNSTLPKVRLLPPCLLIKKLISRPSAPVADPTLLSVPTLPRSEPLSRSSRNNFVYRSPRQLATLSSALKAETAPPKGRSRTLLTKENTPSLLIDVHMTLPPLPPSLHA